MKKQWAAADRNKEPILEVLREELPERGLVLEIASGPGQHAAHFAAALPRLTWQPSDPDPEQRASIAAWRAEADAPDLRAPLDLDVLAATWPIDRADAVLNVNMIHVAPWAAVPALFAGCARILPAGAPLVMYGPYAVGGRHTAESNAEFSASLQARNPAWGVRDLDDVRREADRAGFDCARIIEMPANNLTVVYRRRTATLGG